MPILEPNGEYYSNKFCFWLSFLFIGIPPIVMKLLSYLHNELFLEELLFKAGFECTPIWYLVDTNLVLHTVLVLMILNTIRRIINIRMESIEKISLIYTILTAFTLLASGIISLFMTVAIVLHHPALNYDKVTQVTGITYNYRTGAYTDEELEEALKTILKVDELPENLTEEESLKIADSIISSYCHFYGYGESANIKHFRRNIFALSHIQQTLKSNINPTSLPAKLVGHMLDCRLYTIESDLASKMNDSLIAVWIKDVKNS